MSLLAEVLIRRCQATRDSEFQNVLIVALRFLINVSPQRIDSSNAGRSIQLQQWADQMGTCPTNHCYCAQTEGL